MIEIYYHNKQAKKKMIVIVLKIMKSKMKVPIQ